MEQPFDLALSAATPTPRGRAVLCVWAALPGLIGGAPLCFGRALDGGASFAPCGPCWCSRYGVRACSFVASLDSRTLTLYLGGGLSGGAG